MKKEYFFLFEIFNIFSLEDQKVFIFLLLGLFLTGILEILGIASIAPFMQIISSDNQENRVFIHNFISQYFFQFDIEFLVVFLGFTFATIILITNFLTAFLIWKITFFAKNQGYKISYKLLENYLFEKYEFFINKNTSELSRNILSEVKRCVDGGLLPVMQAISRIIISIFIFGFLIYYNPYITIPIFIFLGSAYFLIYYFYKNTQKSLGEQSSKTVFKRFNAVNETFLGIREVKLNSSEENFLLKFKKPAQDEAFIDAKGTLIASIPRYVIETLIIFCVIFLCTYFYYLNTDHNSNLMLTTLSVYGLAALRLMPSVQQIYYGFSSYRYHYPPFKILIDDIKNLKNNKLNKNNIKYDFNKNIKLKNVSFKYNNSKEFILKNINLDLSKNSKIGIIGKTGSGKSTLIDIISGLLKPTEGSIELDNKKIDIFDNSNWMNKIGYVSQDIFLTNDTIEKNIAFASNLSEIDTYKLNKSAKVAEIDKLIDNLPDKFKTLVGERGINLSGGEKQRISIARAMYNNPEILIFDEATSALDINTEELIFKTINNLDFDTTIIIVAHRLTTLKECDNIYELSNGSLKSLGSYHELQMIN